MVHFKRPKLPSQTPRPDVFKYYEYRLFLSDLFKFERERNPDFSLRALAAKGQIAVGYLPSLLSGKCKFSIRMFIKLSPHLRLSRAELAHLESLIKLSATDSQESRLEAFQRLSQRSTYQRRNPKEAEYFEYMGHWYYIAIREMAACPGFKTDPEWIRGNLMNQVSLAEIKAALNFLITKGYLQVGVDGIVIPPKEMLCQGYVNREALIKYHRQMLSLAAESMEKTPAAKRHLTGFTFSLDSEKYAAAKTILERAMREIEALEKLESPRRNSVYHIELALFPVAIIPDSSEGGMA